MRLSRPLQFLLVFVLAASLAAPGIALAYSSRDVAAHKAAAAAAEKKAAEEQKKANALLTETEKLEVKISALEGELEKLGAQIGTAAQRRANLDSQIFLLRSQVAVKEAGIKKLQSDFDVRSDALSARVDTFYRTGDWAYIEMLLSSENLADLIQRTEFVTMLIQDDEDVANELEASRIALEQANDALARDLETIQSKRTEVRAEELGLKSLQSASDTKRAAEQAAQDQKAAMFAETKKNVARLRAMALAEEQEAARIAAFLKGTSHGSGKYAGTFRWPVPGHTRITSNYGYRICPFHGRELHAGIDIGAPTGSQIIAPGSGTVVQVQSPSQSGGYGNKTMIDHGNGVVTLYGHQSRIVVHVGQHVRAGETIGYVGSTGFSTGPHLHFGVYVNEHSTNPRNYL